MNAVEEESTDWASKRPVRACTFPDLHNSIRFPISLSYHPLSYPRLLYSCVPVTEFVVSSALVHWRIRDWSFAIAITWIGFGL